MKRYFPPSELLIEPNGAVYHLGEDSRCRGLADATRSAEKIGMSQLTAKYRILQGLGDVILTDKRPEGVRSVFSC